MTTKPISRQADRVLLSARARHFEPRALHTRVALYFDRVVLCGWTLRGRIQRTIALSTVRDVDWWTLTNDGPNIALKLNNGTSLAFWVKSPGVWRFRIHELISREAPASDEKRGRITSAA